MRKIIFALLWVGMSVSFAGSTPNQLTVILDTALNPDHAPLLIAKQHGFFKEEGIEVEWREPVAGEDASALVAAGKADIGISNEPRFMQAVSQHSPLICIGTLIDEPLNSIVVLKDSPIKSVADLKGKRIGTNDNGLNLVILKTILKKQGINEKNVTLVQLKQPLMQALLQHKVDAVAGATRNMDIPHLESHHHQFRTFFPETHGVPNYSELIFIANLNERHDARFPRFLAAIRKAVLYLDAHPQQVWREFVKAHPQANNDRNKEAWFATLPYFAEEPTDFDHKEWQRFATFMSQNGLIAGEAQPASRYTI
jgi:putative hydroxymethylpyrimidine transport system substrate-binding protein